MRGLLAISSILGFFLTTSAKRSGFQCHASFIIVLLFLLALRGKQKLRPTRIRDK